MDFASTSTLYPTKEEIRNWENSFESLLSNKYGCLMFREFLKTEYSVENLDFWLECEEFKKMKDGKKATQQRARTMYNQYIAAQAPKEVCYFLTSLEDGAKLNMFSLAQSRIEHLMEKDSYPRFLKSDKFLRLLADVSSEATVKENVMNAEAVGLCSA
uniref:RGS domain-containing protein n=1 Tax=Syphacia muris TaxID=451379 RepID=A0A0N5AQL3_9BILA